MGHAHVNDQGLGCLLGGTSLQGIEHGLPVADGVANLAEVGHCDVPETVEGDEELQEDLRQLWIARRFSNDRMESPVQTGQLPEVTGLQRRLPFPDYLPNFLQLLGTNPLSGEPTRKFLQGQSDFERVFELNEIDSINMDPLAWYSHQKAIGNEPLDDLAQEGATNSQVRG